MMTSEDRYIRKRLREARRQAREFYYCRKYPIQENKIVFTTIEGSTGFSCNPKYIALELLRRNLGLDLVWLVDDMKKEFPKGIRKVKNTLKKRAYELSTAKVWIDNSRKQLEVRKRPGQFYLQTWHGSIWIKPLGLERKEKFSKIAYLVSKHDSQMVDCLLSNSKWLEQHAEIGLVYSGEMIRTGTPRCDVMINGRKEWHRRIREFYNLPFETKILLYAPTFRAGSQGINRNVDIAVDEPDYVKVINAMEERFGNKWAVFLRLHPQLTARHINHDSIISSVINASQYDDIYELLSGCDAVLTDYSSVAFDGAVMGVPTFMYMPDYNEYKNDRGSLVWDINELPFPHAEDDESLVKMIRGFDARGYKIAIQKFKENVELFEQGDASIRAANYILNKMGV